MKKRVHFTKSIGHHAQEPTHHIELSIYNAEGPGHLKIKLTPLQLVQILFGNGQWIPVEAEQWDGGLTLLESEA